MEVIVRLKDADNEWTLTLKKYATVLYLAQSGWINAFMFCLQIRGIKAALSDHLNARVDDIRLDYICQLDF